MYSNQGFTLIL